jgi:hypothetical protein
LEDAKRQQRKNGKKLNYETIATETCPDWHSRTQIDKWVAGTDPRYGPGSRADKMIRERLTKMAHRTL